MKKLAVIMSVYAGDRIEYVMESVGSILNQTFSDFDYFIAFDGPVAPKVEVFLDDLHDERIKLFRIEENAGLATTLNFLLEKILEDSGYEFIARMDADDISMPERFEKQISFLNNHPDVDCLGSWYEKIDGNSMPVGYIKMPACHEALRKRYFLSTPFAHPSVMFRRRFIVQTGFYPSNTLLMEDNVLWGRALMKGMRFANLQEILLSFRVDSSFYKRRSGIKYGWNYIKTRFRVFGEMNTPWFAYLPSLILGLIKMLPAPVSRVFYVFR